MRCPECKREFHPQPDATQNYWVADDSPDTYDAFGVAVQLCPSCSEMLVIYRSGQGRMSSGVIQLWETTEQRVIYPGEPETPLPPEIPDEYKKDWTEAQLALDYSPKASAALSRRLLQKTLHEKLGIKRKDLSLEIDAFIETSGAPTYLTSAVDAVRQIGNFAAHPLKFTNSGEIVEVEDGEAEWLLEVLESLFDFVFVQPAKLDERRQSLNLKLQELGKPPLKGA